MTTKTNRDIMHVFIGLPQGSNGVSREVRNLLNQLAAGALDYYFTFFEAQSYSAPKARNIIVHAARKTDAATLIMIDSDMNPSVEHIKRLLMRDERVLGCIYPKKVFAESPEWVCHWTAEQAAAKDADGVCECIEIGAGALKIAMSVFDELAPNTLEYFSDDVGIYGELVLQFFKEDVVTWHWGPGAAPWARLLGEDFYFCWLCRINKIPVHSHCGAQMGHIGPMDFLRAFKLLEDLTASAPHGSTLPELPRHT